MPSAEKSTGQDVLEQFAAILELGRKAVDVIADGTDPEAAARAYRALQAARAALETAR